MEGKLISDNIDFYDNFSFLERVGNELQIIENVVYQSPPLDNTPQSIPTLLIQSNGEIQDPAEIRNRKRFKKLENEKLVNALIKQEATKAVVGSCDECAVCLIDFNIKENLSMFSETGNEPDILSKLDCGHVFHYECVKKWLSIEKFKNECPVCRQKAVLT